MKDVFTDMVIQESHTTINVVMNNQEKEARQAYLDAKEKYHKI